MPTQQPIVIVGGFLSYPGAYHAMRDTLTALTGQAVRITPIYTPEWLLNASRAGWRILLRRVDRCVSQVLQASATGKVTLVGHSAGGVLARLYLSPGPFLSPAAPGPDRVGSIITLGSPHYTHSRGLHSSGMDEWLEGHTPGAWFAPQVRYTAVAGKLVQGDPVGTPQQRRAYRYYRPLGGDGEEWGDGLIPVTSALLKGARPVILEGVSHAGVFGADWYGTPHIVRQWWQAAIAEE